MVTVNNTYSNYLSGLSSRQGFWDGFMSLFNIFDNFDSLLKFGSREDDLRNITSDWERIGGSICSASEKLNNK